jgi:hypothetical protein
MTRPPPRPLASRVVRFALKWIGAVVLIATGRGLPKPGEDRLWRESHPDDDR